MMRDAGPAALDPEIAGGRPVHFTDISNVVADFMAVAYRADDTAFDRYLRGDATALDDRQKAGMDLFYGKAGCASCHSGALMSDQAFHGIAMPQFGPGKTARFETSKHDMGRMRVTGDPADAYHFRTPPLRNVALTAPYGHDGAYATLEGVIRQHLDPTGALAHYDRGQVVLPSFSEAEAIDWTIMDDPGEVAAIAAAADITPVSLTDDEIDALVAFLDSLTDKTFLTRTTVPDTVPSGLPVDK